MATRWYKNSFVPVSMISLLLRSVLVAAKPRTSSSSSENIVLLPEVTVHRTAFQVVLSEASDAPSSAPVADENDSLYEYGFDYEDVSLVPVTPSKSPEPASGQACNTVLDGLEATYPEFHSLTTIMSQVTPRYVNNVLADSGSNLTILMPPATESVRVRTLFERSQLTRADVRDIVLVHIIPRRLTLQDLKEMPPGSMVPTMLDGSALSLSPAGRTSGSGDGISSGLIDADLEICAKNSVLHLLDDLLVPDDLYDKFERVSAADADAFAESVPSDDDGVKDSKSTDPFFLQYPKSSFIVVALTVLVAMVGCCLCWRLRRLKLSKRLNRNHGDAKDDASTGVKAAEPDFMIPPEQLHAKTAKNQRQVMAN